VSLITAELVCELLACLLESVESCLELGLILDINPHVVLFILQGVAKSDVLVWLYNA